MKEGYLDANLSQSTFPQRILSCRELSECIKGPFSGLFTENWWLQPRDCSTAYWVGCGSFPACVLHSLLARLRSTKKNSYLTPIPTFPLGTATVLCRILYLQKDQK